tara:strand:- start:1739 stop:2485 length:747 start_codon:yes stop_codon:yes gene_type:complete
MNLLTLDSVVRTHILESGMVWHDYFRCLTIAISGYKKLCEDINLGTNIKAQVIDVSTTNRLLIPTDAVSVIGLYVENGDKILPMSISNDINPLVLKDSTGTPVKRNQESGLTYYSPDYLYGATSNDRGEYVGRDFGIPNNQPYKYRLIDGEIQLDVRVNATCILVVYATNGLSVTDVNMVHPLAEQAIKFYVEWKWSERNREKGIWEKRNAESAYLNEKRLLKGRIVGLTWAEYLTTIREYQVATAKY